MRKSVVQSASSMGSLVVMATDLTPARVDSLPRTSRPSAACFTFCLVFLRLRVYLHHGNVVRLKSDIHMQEAIEAFAQQTSARQKHHGGREFDDDEL